MFQLEMSETPLMQQYKSLKAGYPHAILFFRLGDFYEMFGEDAKKASSVLGVVLTSRQGVPMCGVPYHSASNYISRLLDSGHKVAICEQTGQDEKNPKLFRREVVRLITPGTVVEDELLDNKNASYLASVETDIVGWGLSYIELSTGEFFSTQNTNDPDMYLLAAVISRISPSEIIAGPSTCEKIARLKMVGPKTAMTRYFNPAGAPEWAGKHIWRNNKMALKTALNTLSYLKETQPGLKRSFEPVFFDPLNKMVLDEAAVKMLEIVSPQHDGGKSLWDILDNCKTAMGSRQLKRWLLEPLRDLKQIKERQDAVSFLCEDSGCRESLAEIFSEIPDVERILGRIINMSASPKDAAAVRKTLNHLPKLKLSLASPGFFNAAPHLASGIENLSSQLQKLRLYLHKTLADNPPAKPYDGGMIRKGYSKELDDLRELKKNIRSVLIEIEESEREKNRIPSLKIKYNSVFGYYIEVTKSHLDKVPPHYTRKQTLVSAERFITPRLKEIESKILGAEERISKLEIHIFNEIKSELLENLRPLRDMAVFLSEIDALRGLSESAIKYDYTRPQITTDAEMFVEEGRHPVVEHILPSGNFVPNDIKIGGEDAQIMILTGPNMSGKSVYLRQNALISIMAQAGSFVPAKMAVLPLLDRIMTRIGAHDRLSKGESTFMVEMREVSSILRLATDKSLVILDEVGRGTSTFDGISLAWAIIEYLRRKKGGPKVLFATHYFELTDLAGSFGRIKNFNVAVREWMNSEGQNQVVFLHRIIPGSADKSYGIHVAQLAGLPPKIITRAKEILSDLESKNFVRAEGRNGVEEQFLFPVHPKSPVTDEIRKTDIDNITGLEALSLIGKWKKKLEKN